MRISGLMVGVLGVLLGVGGGAGAEQGGRGIEISFSSPGEGETVAGRTFEISFDVQGFLFGDNGKGVLLLDGGKLFEVRQSSTTIRMDGLGALHEGEHALRLVLLDTNGNQIAHQDRRFLKEGAPEESAGPFHDDQYDDEALPEMQAACARMAEKRQNTKKQADKGTKIIALGMPVLSSKHKYDGEEEDDMRMVQVREKFISEIDDLPMLKVFIPSLMEKIPQEKGSYEYKVYFGYDKGDPLFDNLEKRTLTHQRLQELVVGHPITFYWFQYEGMEGKVFWIYNDLFRQAYNNGDDYFYMVNDDLLLVTPGWVDRFVHALETSPAMPGFGVAGPLDIRDRHKHHMCFAFHSRVHYEIFGEFYPSSFQNWWSDYWASLVYGPETTFWFKDVEVRNTEIEGRRYPAFWEGNEYFAEEVSSGRRKLAAYCNCAADGGKWRFSGCESPPFTSAPSTKVTQGNGVDKKKQGSTVQMPRKPPSFSKARVDL